MSAMLFAILGGALAGHLTAKAYDEYADPVMEERHADRIEEFEEEARAEARAEARRRRFEAFANGGYPPYGAQPQMPALYPQVPQMPVVPQSSAELMGWQAAQNSIAALQQQLMQKQAMPQTQPVTPAAPAQAAPQAQPAPAAPTTSASDAALVQVLQQLNQRLTAVEQLSNLVTAAIAEEAAADAKDGIDDAADDDVEVIPPENEKRRDAKGRFSKK